MGYKSKNKDIYAFHPGEYLIDLIEEYSLTQEDFAKRLGITPEIIRKLIRGETDISSDIALKLSEFTGTSSELWLNLQKQYDQIQLSHLEDTVTD